MNRSLAYGLTSRIGALCYASWGIFHLYVALDIWRLGAGQAGIAQGRTFQLAFYMASIALFAIIVAIGNWRGDVQAYWRNLLVIGWADVVWVGVVVLPGYVPLLRGLLPPAIYVLGACLTTAAYRMREGQQAKA
ncbi:hypothetical protein [Dyella sp.]|uniref:hypothetical protein n=1 Tax=Dyella sp. TaxID=1869338 RepID=UPI002ED3D122